MEKLSSISSEFWMLLKQWLNFKIISKFFSIVVIYEVFWGYERFRFRLFGSQTLGALDMANRFFLKEKSPCFPKNVGGFIKLIRKLKYIRFCAFSWFLKLNLEKIWIQTSFMPENLKRSVISERGFSFIPKNNFRDIFLNLRDVFQRKKMKLWGGNLVLYLKIIIFSVAFVRIVS